MQPTTSPNRSLVRRGMIYCNALTRHPRGGRDIPALTIEKRISLPQRGTVRITGLVGNSKPMVAPKIQRAGEPRPYERIFSSYHHARNA